MEKIGLIIVTNSLKMRRKNLNLKTKTKSKLEFYRRRLEDLQECLKENLTKDCRHYCNQEIKNCEENIEYYTCISEILEGGNNEK